MTMEKKLVTVAKDGQTMQLTELGAKIAQDFGWEPIDNIKPVKLQLPEEVLQSIESARANSLPKRRGRTAKK